MKFSWQRHLIYPLYELGTGRRILTKWKELERTQWLSPTELWELQAERLGALLRHAYDTVPYYRRTFDAAGIRPTGVKRVCDMCRLPVLTKSTIQACRNELISTAFSPRQLLPNQTGGSTGISLRFYQDRRQRDWGSANKLRSNRWAGWDFGKRVLRLWGHPEDVSIAHSLSGRLRDAVLNERTLNAFRFSESDLYELVNYVRRRRPQVIVAYASMLVHWVNYIKDRQITNLPAADGIVSSADMLLPHQRARIENVLGAPVFDRYGCREVDTIASECGEHAGLHINVDRLVVEFLDKDGHPVSFGQPGRVVVTDLFNYAMPFIRYDIEDLATPLGKGCCCGRGLPLMTELSGRLADVLTTPEGAFVSSSALASIIPEIPGVREMQFVQMAVDWLKVKVVCQEHYTRVSERSFGRRLAKLFGPRMRITFEYVDRIPKAPSGKARLSVSEPGARASYPSELAPREDA